MSFFSFGIYIAIAIFVLVEYLIEKVNGLEKVNTTDKNVWYDQESNRCNIMSCLILTKTTEEDLRNTFQHKMSRDWKRFRCTMLKILDTYYLKELKGDELKAHIDKVVTVCNDVKTMEDVE